MNPYDFVPIDLKNLPCKKSPFFHHRFDGLSGKIYCRLSTETPIFIPKSLSDEERERLSEMVTVEGREGKHYKKPFHIVNGIPVIPGSSLKGVVRSVAEAVANSCFSVFDIAYHYKHFGKQVSIKYNLPNTEFMACNDIRSLCITCRLFGMQSKENVFLGKVNISDAKATAYELMEWLTLPELSNPKPHHKAFYESPYNPSIVSGRKFYFHSSPPSTNAGKTWRNVTVQPLKKGVFEFEVDYQSLDQEEFDLLLYSLFLEDGMCHKIGMGKPVGLGSIKITPLKILQRDMTGRYKNYGSDSQRKIEGNRLNEFIEERTRKYRTDTTSPNIVALRRIWQYPTSIIKYPDLPWFKSNPDAPISSTP